MRRAEVLQEIRQMRFEEIELLRTEKSLTIEQAAELLGVDERTFRRWKKRYDDKGAEESAKKLGVFQRLSNSRRLLPMPWFLRIFLFNSKSRIPPLK